MAASLSSVLVMASKHRANFDEYYKELAYSGISREIRDRKGVFLKRFAIIF
jgi:hypothetical protein